jgi:hypothetical protein
VATPFRLQVTGPRLENVVYTSKSPLAFQGLKGKTVAFIEVIV